MLDDATVVDGETVDRVEVATAAGEPAVVSLL
jgi:hypothetical protein